MWKEFKEFAFQGNVLDMAIGVIIGSAFGKIVASLVSDLIMPAIGVVIGNVNFRELKIVVGEVSADGTQNAILYGSFLQNVFDFLVIAVCIFFFVKLINKFKTKREEAEETTSGPSTEELLTEIRDLLKDKK
jgi:large conductance mechanosensitive channel protein